MPVAAGSVPAAMAPRSTERISCVSSSYENDSRTFGLAHPTFVRLAPLSLPPRLAPIFGARTGPAAVPAHPHRAIGCQVDVYTRWQLVLAAHLVRRRGSRDFTGSRPDSCSRTTLIDIARPYAWHQIRIVPRIICADLPRSSNTFGLQ